MPAHQRHRFWLFVVVLMCYVLSFFQRFAPAGIAQDLSRSFQISATSLGALASTYFYVYTVMQIPTGILADTWGARKLLLVGGLIGGIGSLLFGFAPTFAWALVGRVLIGLGVSVTFIAMLKLVAVWFEETRFATVVGLCILLGNLGSVLAGAPLSMVAGAMGWRSVFVVVGLLSLVLAALCWMVVRDRPADVSANKEKISGRMVWENLLLVVRNRDTLPALLVNMGMSGAFFTFAGLWAMPYLMQVHQMTRAQAALHLSVWAMGFALGCWFIGTLSDRLGRRKPVVLIMAYVHALMWWGLVFVGAFSNGLGYVFFMIMGLVTSGFSLTWACAKEVNPPQLSGISTSVANMGGFLGAALMQPFVGWVMDLGWAGEMAHGVRVYEVSMWQYGTGVVAIAATLGALSTGWLRETRCQNVWRARD